MIYETLGTIECRQATINDYIEMYDLVSKYVVEDNMHENEKKSELRALDKSLRFAIRQGDAIVNVDNGKVVAVYTGVQNKIMSLCNEGGVHSAAMLLKVALCDLQNKYKEAEFQVNNGKIRQQYEAIRTRKGSACTISERGKGTISTKAKEEIAELFYVLKG